MLGAVTLGLYFRGLVFLSIACLYFCFSFVAESEAWDLGSDGRRFLVEDEGPLALESSLQSSSDLHSATSSSLELPSVFCKTEESGYLWRQTMGVLTIICTSWASCSLEQLKNENMKISTF